MDALHAPAVARGEGRPQRLVTGHQVADGGAQRVRVEGPLIRTGSAEW